MFSTNAHNPSFSPLPSPGYHISGKEVEVCDSDSGHHQLSHHHGVPTLPKQRGPLPLLWYGCRAWVLYPSASPPLQPPFRLLPQSVTPASIPIFFQLYWAAIVSMGRCGPMAWSQSSPSSHAGPVTRGSCFPVTFSEEVTPIPLAQSKAPAI